MAHLVLCLISEDMSSSVGLNRKGGKPQVAIYRPGSGPLRKSAYGEEDFLGETSSRYENNMSRDKKDYNDHSRSETSRVTDDFDRLSLCSHKDGRSTQSLSGSVGNLSDLKRRPKKPEIPIYIPPKPSAPVEMNQVPPDFKSSNSGRTFKSRNYGNSQRSDSMRREDSFRKENMNDYHSKESDLHKRDSRREGDFANRVDPRNARGESEPPLRKPEDKRNQKRKSRKKGGRGDRRDENLNTVNNKQEDKITPLMDIKFDYNPVMGRKPERSNPKHGNETSDYITTDGESEREISSTMNKRPLPNRDFRQASEPRSLPLTSIQTENRLRDSRSVEPAEENWSQDKYTQKPPSGQYGKRNGKSGHSKFNKPHVLFESLPPRLQKKYMEDYGLQEPSLPSSQTYTSLNTEKSYLGSNPDVSTITGVIEPDPNSYIAFATTSASYAMPPTKPSYLGVTTTFIGTNSEDPWDGSSSLTFQGTSSTPSSINYPANTPSPNPMLYQSNHDQYYPTVPHMVFTQPPPSLNYTHMPPPPVWSQTLPPVRMRGRGRVPQHELERDKINFEDPRMTRSLTPDALRDLDRFQDAVSNEFHSLVNLQEKSPQSTGTKEPLKSPKVEDLPSPNRDQQRGLVREESASSLSSNKVKSPDQPKSPKDLNFVSSGTGMVSLLLSKY